MECTGWNCIELSWIEKRAAGWRSLKWCSHHKLTSPVDLCDAPLNTKWASPQRELIFLSNKVAENYPSAAWLVRSVKFRHFITRGSLSLKGGEREREKETHISRTVSASLIACNFTWVIIMVSFFSVCFQLFEFSLRRFGVFLSIHFFPIRPRAAKPGPVLFQVRPHTTDMSLFHFSISSTWNIRIRWGAGAPIQGSHVNPGGLATCQVGSPTVVRFRYQVSCQSEAYHSRYIHPSMLGQMKSGSAARPTKMIFVLYDRNDCPSLFQMTLNKAVCLLVFNVTIGGTENLQHVDIFRRQVADKRIPTHRL